MSTRPRSSSSSSRCVLSLGSGAAEWLVLPATGAPRYARCAADDETPEALVRAAVEARLRVGSPPSRCVVALGASIAAQRLLSLPELARKDQRTVLLRKAAQLLGTQPEDALFSALDSSGGGRAGEEHRWLLAALKRSLAGPLFQALRRAGFDVQRAVPARLARLSRAEELADSRAGAVLVLDIVRGSVSVSLLHRHQLVHQTLLEGDLVATPALALAVVQEARGFESFWRKQSRGESLSRAVVIGLSGERGDLFAHALSSALGQLAVARPPEREGTEHSGQVAALEACLARGPYDLDLNLPLPAAPVRRASYAAGLVVAVVGLGFVAHANVRSALEDVSRDSASLLARSNGLEDVETRNRAVEDAQTALERETARLFALEAKGIPLERTLTEAFQAFGSDGRLLSVGLGRDGEGGDVLLGGETHPHPLRSMRAVEAIRERLGRSPCFAEVEVQTPAALPESERGVVHPFGFAFKARRRRA